MYTVENSINLTNEWWICLRLYTFGNTINLTNEWWICLRLYTVGNSINLSNEWRICLRLYTVGNSRYLTNEWWICLRLYTLGNSRYLTNEWWIYLRLYTVGNSINLTNEWWIYVRLTYDETLCPRTRRFDNAASVAVSVCNIMSVYNEYWPITDDTVPQDPSCSYDAVSHGKRTLFMSLQLMNHTLRKVQQNK